MRCFVIVHKEERKEMKLSYGSVIIGSKIEKLEITKYGLIIIDDKEFAQVDPENGWILFKDSSIGCGTLSLVFRSRTFDTPDDMNTLMKKLLEREGAWVRFFNDTWYIWYDTNPDSETALDEVSHHANYCAWLMEPKRFCGLVAEWLAQKEGV
jgi:hypothetical protein